MQYALFGDIHSSKKDLEKVLAHISNISPEALQIGTGDVFECIISKKDITDYKFSNLEEVMILPEGFTKLLTFPSIRGNQEERLLFITETNDPLRDKLTAMPETYAIGQAEVIHGHQWRWGGNPWTLIEAKESSELIFYGHSHRSELRMNGVQREIEFGISYFVGDARVLVNVGAVIDDREWVLYDSLANTVTFMKVGVGA